MARSGHRSRPKQSSRGIAPARADQVPVRPDDLTAVSPAGAGGADATGSRSSSHQLRDPKKTRQSRNAAHSTPGRAERAAAGGKALQSPLAVDIVMANVPGISHAEIDAIERLLGEELRTFLAGLPGLGEDDPS